MANSRALRIGSAGVFEEFDLIASGGVAPTSTPEHVGALYVDTAAKVLYVGKGIASATDWFPSCSAPEYAHASLPAAASVPGLEVWNTTYSVKMRSNGTRWIPLAPFRVYANSGDLTVTNTTTLTTIASFTIPGGLLGTGMLRAVALWETTTGTSNTRQLLIYLGGVAMVSNAGYAASVRTISGVYHIRNITETSQVGPLAVSTGIGTTGGAPATGSVDTTVPFVVDVAFKMAALAETMTMKNLYIEIVP